MTDRLQSPPPPIPPRPPAQRHGCLTALMILGGTILLLPGICAFLIVSFDSSVLRDASAVAIGVAFLAVGIGGLVLIWFAIRPAR